MVRERLSSGTLMLAPLILLGALALRPAGPLSVALAAPALPGTAADQLTVAADKIAQATSKDGSGFSFTVVARSTLYTQPGGPKIEVPDPIDRFKTLGARCHNVLNTRVPQPPGQYAPGKRLG